MSVRVLEQIFDRSHARGTARCVLTALGDAAHHDGVTWAPQGPQTNRRSIAHRANCSVSSVERAVRDLVELNEVEVRRARRGRSWVNVYRVIVGSIGQSDVQYDRLPFNLDEHFSNAVELATSGARSTRQLEGMTEGAEVEPEGGSHGDVEPNAHARKLRGSTEAFNPADQGDSTPQIGAFNPADALPTPSIEDPSGEPKTDPSARATPALVDAAAVELTRKLTRLRVAPAMRQRALEDVGRAAAWVDVARTKARENPAGFFVSGFLTGDWPTARGQAPAQAWGRRESAEASLRNLMAEGVDEADARYFVDVEWDWLTSVERSEFHELIDELLSDRLPAADEQERGVA